GWRHRGSVRHAAAVGAGRPVPGCPPRLPAGRAGLPGVAHPGRHRAGQPDPGEPVITTRGLTKRYGRTLAVDSVDLDVREGDRYGFLGPNGSGKTTLIRLLLGLVYATSGEIEMLGRPVPRRLREVLPQVGALVEGPAAYPHLSGRTNL